MNCLFCNHVTSNPKYCSKSCAAKANNKLFPKRKTTRKCTQCNEATVSCRTTLCKIHLAEFNASKTELLKTKTIGEYRALPSVKGKHPSWIHAHIRVLNRSWNKELTSKPCANCGYSKHVELCHRKPISDFLDDALVGEVNHPTNIVQLCRNCHWEFDNGLLII